MSSHVNHRRWQKNARIIKSLTAAYRMHAARFLR